VTVRCPEPDRVGVDGNLETYGHLVGVDVLAVFVVV
jgi:hypothetical protein